MYYIGTTFKFYAMQLTLKNITLIYYNYLLALKIIYLRNVLKFNRNLT